MDWLIGDLQGCDDALGRLLAAVDFSPSRDRLWLLGDLVSRGPQSLATLRRVVALGAQAVLGNHDLHLLAVAAGVRKAKKSEQLDALLQAPDRELLLDWLRARPLVAQAPGWLLVHAGLLPGWSAEQALALSAEVEALLRDPQALSAFWPQMYGNQPDLWRDELQGPERLRTIINACTRLRFVDLGGRMDFETKEGADAAPPGLLPWFEHPQRASRGTPIAFGHWSTLGLINQPDLLALDTGCVWGGCLSAARIDGGRREIVQVRCEQAQKPG
ncbi:symmetrical bis(5'-nucleosyl)-tetraphosphatase [Inhella proteolytica]|uniref:bis(5'-nucleosyl)-tetraphosphatase (symmetrical) n=1 Tax=Inhella proteolytica TaxID=2795029 RepID=A0A931NH88_9BURK|nr:symmetrical bis(5'-nucleosyl)-tetraphosphatase [Inhella proteolytica]MBH9577488.1 symmetrical bis(5'-nucleosyl)-tetraphosphatase [Inhella proteolytica]